MSFSKLTLLLTSGAALGMSMMPTVSANPDHQRVIVNFQPGSHAAVMRSVERAGGRQVVDLQQHHAMAIEVPAQALNGLRNNPNVLFIEEDVKREPMSEYEPGAPYGISLVQADQVTAQLASGRKVCIIDSGYDLGHPDLQTNFVTGEYDSGSGDWYVDGNGHGTHVAGTIAAVSNGEGVVGVIPNAELNLHIVKVFDANGWAYSSSLIAAADQCAAYGANVINMSLGGSRASNTERNAFSALNDAGVLSIAAAGNDGTTAYSYPASYDAVMSVAAIDSNKQLADFSQRNDQVEISGPGVDVLSTVPRGMGQVSTFTAGGSTFAALGMEGSVEGDVTGPLVDCGLGTSTCTNAQDAVCLIERGDISFADKALACEAGGGVAAVIYNNVAGALSGTLGTTNVSIPTVGISDVDGASALTSLGQSASVTLGAGDYASFNGTSMATPHVVGVAALVWSHFPECTNNEIRDALKATAENLGAANSYGAGLVQAKDAYDYLTLNGCAGGDTGGGDGGDNGGDTGGASIELAGQGGKVRGRWTAELSWTGTSTTQVDIFRDGALIDTVNDSGAYTDSTNMRGGGSLTYQVCEAGTSVCSEQVTVQF
ncbi:MULTISPECIES: S8 family serine peptidase [Gammaproteobacteria]|uniref:S8 family serine peptidase n=1 Tax=Gammaproteobacteria TaxID=1236 RepID=UPI000DCF763E|nr:MULTISPECIES: S8 family serine peptidase [Gammaproteobacteria]RTE85676.1 peptidase S8 [Aliidiomarina sp. B3213]TCZ90321.1 peptidase S8 [Lysobacter sp. N42]